MDRSKNSEEGANNSQVSDRIRRTDVEAKPGPPKDDTFTDPLEAARPYIIEGRERQGIGQWCVVNVLAMHAVVISRLQEDLIIAAKDTLNNEAPSRLRHLIHEYCT